MKSAEMEVQIGMFFVKYSLDMVFISKLNSELKRLANATYV